MRHAFPLSGQAVATLLFALPLAALGFRVATWGGLMAGGLVGAVIAARLLMRGVAEAGSLSSPAVIIAGVAADDTAEVDARRVARLKREFDVAVLDSGDAVVSERSMNR